MKAIEQIYENYKASQNEETLKWSTVYSSV